MAKVPSLFSSLRRVVVTGLGAVMPLGCGVDLTWQRLIEGKCGIRAIRPEDLRLDCVDEATLAYTYEQLSSKVAAPVPRGIGEGEFNEEAILQSKVLQQHGSSNQKSGCRYGPADTVFLGNIVLLLSSVLFQLLMDMYQLDTSY